MPDFQIQIVPVTPFQQNCSICWSAGTKRATVVDPGGDVEVIRGALAKLGVTVERILLTHGHIDHAGGAADLAEALGVEIIGPHENDRPLLERLEQQAAQFGLDDVRNVVPTRFLAEGEQVEIGGAVFDVLHCPGHSPGSLVYNAPELGFALMGDVLFQGSVGRTDLPGGTPALVIPSTPPMGRRRGDAVSFLPGPGRGSTIGQERLTNPFLV